MSCSVHIELPKPKPIRVNGKELSRAEISREAQNFPAEKPIEAWQGAARALVIRDLLLSEAKRLAIVAVPQTEDGRTETEDEASIRALLEQQVVTPNPDEAACLRYYVSNHARFRSAAIYEAAHILVTADRRDAPAYRAAREKIEQIASELRQFPEKFDMLAVTHSDCPSSAQNGNLGQITDGQTTPEFEKALVSLTPGSISDPVESRYGLHIIRLDRKIDGKQLPFDAVRERIADYLRDAVQRRASAQYIARLVSAAKIEGIDLAGAEAHRVS
ncbi:MAG: peptidylprolyl isomerase [Xanthobacteraceae bacterium]|nr:peptidylprolyl isomerase [Xanthobacteraceae bacterium]QYK44193.1 MAG: peptidylprolyl isomerase [Xanthobacteraceae bacterium]